MGSSTLDFSGQSFISDACIYLSVWELCSSIDHSLTLSWNWAFRLLRLESVTQSNRKPLLLRWNYITCNITAVVQRAAGELHILWSDLLSEVEAHGSGQGACSVSRADSGVDTAADWRPRERRRFEVRWNGERLFGRLRDEVTQDDCLVMRCTLDIWHTICLFDVM